MKTSSLMPGKHHRVSALLALTLMAPLLVAAFLLAMQMKDRWFLCVSVKSSVNGNMQIFYDIGNGLNEKDSVTEPVIKTDDFRALSFLLPNQPIQYLRIDPLSGEGHFSLKDIKIVNGLKQIVGRVGGDRVKPLHRVVNVAIQNDAFVADTEPGATDPTLFLDVKYPLTNKTDYFTAFIYGIAALLCGFMACYAVAYLSICFFHKIKLSLRRGVFGENALINFSLLAVSTAAGIAIAYVAYRHVMQPAKPAVYQGQGGDYALSLYNNNGQKISEQNGNLKIRLDPFTLYANYPNQTSASYSINGDGFRNTYARAPAPDKLAIVLGGSAAFGQGLPSDNDTFASHIARLNQTYRVMNASTIGFLSGQELSQMVHVLDRFSPALYIVFDGWNDIFDPSYYAGRWPVTGAPIGFNNTFLMVEKQLAAAFAKEHPPENGSAMALPAASKTFADEQEYFQEILSTYSSNLSRMNAFAHARKAKFLVVFQPELTNKKILSEDEQAIIKQWKKAYLYHDKGIPEKYSQLVRQAKNFCKEHAIAYIDINEEPKFSENPHTLFYDVVHLNEDGHKLIAELVNTVMTEQF